MACCSSERRGCVSASRSVSWPRAIIRATILFTLAHVVTFDGTDLPNALALIAVGAGSRVPVAIALGWLYVRRGSLWAPIGLHATYNAVLLALGYLAINARPPA